MIALNHLLYFVLLFWEIDSILQIKDSIKKKNLRFVENLKHDLRRNNDDYVDITRNANDTQVLNNKVTSAQEFTARRVNENEDVRNKLIDKIRRRVNDALLSKESKDIGSSENNHQRRASITAFRSAVSKNLIIAPINQIPPSMKQFWKNLNKIKPKSGKAIPDQIKSYSNKSNESNRTSVLSHNLQSTTHQSSPAMVKIKPVFDKQKLIKKTKMEKFKKFIDRNKGLLKEFISSKMASQTPVTLTTRRLDLRVLKRISESELRKVIEGAVSGLQDNSSENFPNAELLDMAPAKGGRIHHKRLRGRLCHRHVLAPEGPKYDSAGRAYGRRAAGGGREYGRTREPSLLLPRCCNCCRKSVLGCQ